MTRPKYGFLAYLNEFKPKGRDDLEKWWNNYLNYLAVKELKCTKA